MRLEFSALKLPTYFIAVMPAALYYLHTQNKIVFDAVWTLENQI